MSNPARGRNSFSENSRSSRVRRGVDTNLEAAADAILNNYRSGISKHADQKDFLTEHQMRWRVRKEIYTSSGTPEKKIVSGIFKRSYAPPRRKGPRDTREDD